MLKGLLKARIIVIFLLPAIALFYFSFHIASNKFDELQESAVYTLAAKITKVVTALVHSIQIERGLSSGFVVLTDDGLYSDELLRQYSITDKAYQQFLFYSNLVSKEKKDLQSALYRKNKVKIKEVLAQMQLVSKMRAEVQKHTVKFEDVIAYYTQINTNLIGLVYNLSLYSHQSFDNSMEIYKIQEIKERAGLERAYLYKQLLSKKRSLVHRRRLEELIAEQYIFIKELHNDLSPKCMKLYNKVITLEAQNYVNQFRDDFWEEKIDDEDAKDWFSISTVRINEFEKFSSIIIERFIEHMEIVQADVKNSLLITLMLWIMSGISLLFFIYIFVKSIMRETKLVEDLRIASYAFDSHEAMMIMDSRGVVLRINRAFSKITGYEAKEVTGKSPKMLGSLKNTKSFYKNIWQKLHMDGYWSGETYNKRKTGEIYITKLSVVAIKNIEDITTHYIVQFLDISELKEAQDHALHRANHDFLTQLPNRESVMLKLEEEYARAQRHHFHDAFLFIDLDDFKQVNDTYGHLVGDMLLQEVASRLNTNVRVEDFVARISGDEFCVILVDLNHDRSNAKESTNIVCQSLLTSLMLPYFIDGHMIGLGASIGIKLFPEGDDEINTIIHDADVAMYEAKRRGKNRCVYFDNTIKECAIG